MAKMSFRRLALVALLASLVIGTIWAGGCTAGDETDTQIIENITPQEAFTLIQDNEGNMDFVIIDVRTPEEFDSGHIENAANIDFNSMTFRDDIDKLDKDKIYIVYCRTGFLSGQALDIMEELGFNEVYKPSGGIEAWIDAGLPVTGGNG